MSFFQIIALIDIGITIFDRLFSGVRQAEETHGPGKGPEKKAEVTATIIDAIDTTIDTVIAVSTGGQKETWEKIKAVKNPIMGIIDKLISFAAGAMYPKGTTTPNHDDGGV